jgi:hypothetical protein
MRQNSPFGGGDNTFNKRQYALKQSIIKWLMKERYVT